MLFKNRDMSTQIWATKKGQYENIKIKNLE